MSIQRTIARNKARQTFNWKAIAVKARTYFAYIKTKKHKRATPKYVEGK